MGISIAREEPGNNAWILCWVFSLKSKFCQDPDFLAFHVTYMLDMAVVGSWIRI